MYSNVRRERLSGDIPSVKQREQKHPEIGINSLIFWKSGMGL
jgi:hypothetical protein